MESQHLTVEAFLILREVFFDANAKPIPFKLPPKGSTQDDPFDVYVSRLLSEQLPGADCQRSPGPLTTPDMVIYRPEECSGASRASLREDVSRIVAIEVKKLGRASSGQVARSTGLDYNTTPPCGTIRIYDASDIPLDIHAFYLFVCQEPVSQDEVQVTALTLCDGDILNRDFEFYLSITGLRTKGIGLGTYGDGINRQRPMLVFANPLGAMQLDHAATLITKSDPPMLDTRMTEMYQFGRTETTNAIGLFQAWRKTEDVPNSWTVQHLLDPFPQPVKRQATTQGRGRFHPAITVAP